VQEARERKAEQMRAQKDAKKEKQRKAAERQVQRVGAAWLQRDVCRRNAMQPVAPRGSNGGARCGAFAAERRAQSAVLTQRGAMT
jgi:hypothetical protein